VKLPQRKRALQAGDDLRANADLATDRAHQRVRGRGRQALLRRDGLHRAARVVAVEAVPALTKYSVSSHGPKISDSLGETMLAPRRPLLPAIELSTSKS
jgi:hypothetical protein